MTATADQIKLLAENPIIKDAFANVREFYRDRIEETPVSDDTALLDIRKMLYLLRQVEEDLQYAIENGRLEDFRAADNTSFLGDLTAWNRQNKPNRLRSG